jgi:hypothetical protein
MKSYYINKIYNSEISTISGLFDILNIKKIFLLLILLGLITIMPVSANGIDSHTLRMLHLNGTDGSQIFYDSSPNTANSTFIVVGIPKINTRDPNEFGGAVGNTSHSSSFTNYIKAYATDQDDLKIKILL